MEKTKTIETLFFRIKPVKVLVRLFSNGLKDNSGVSLCREIDCTYSHMNKLTHDLKELGLVNIKKGGRTNNITLTDKGKLIAENLYNISMVK